LTSQTDQGYETQDQKVNNPLKENKIGCGTKENSNALQSGSVKVNRTNMATFAAGRLETDEAIDGYAGRTQTVRRL